MGVDRMVTEWLIHLQGGSGINAIIRILGVYAIWALLVLFLVLVFKEEGERRKAYLLGFTFLLVLAARGIITEIIRFFIKRPSPSSALGLPLLGQGATVSSFPSGHAVIMASLVCIIAMMAHKRWTIAAIVVAVLSGLAWIAMGVHWFSDILAGFVLAVVVFFILYRILPPSFGTSSSAHPQKIEEPEIT